MPWPEGLPASLIRSESGGNFQAQNRERGAGGKHGHYGRGQFGHARLQDAKRAGVIPEWMTPAMFMADPRAQESVERWHVQDIMRQVQKQGLDRYIGKTVNGVTMTPDNMIAVAHLGGVGGLKRYLESDGRSNPSDSFGTSLADYAKIHGNRDSTGRSLGVTGPAPTIQEFPIGAQDVRPPPYDGPPKNALAEPDPRQRMAMEYANALRQQQPGQEFQPLDAQGFMAKPPQYAPPQNAFAQVEYRPRYLTRR